VIIVKLLVVCEDAFDIGFYRSIKKKMPVHNRIMRYVSTVYDNGVISTWPIWTTFATGKTRDVHGITKFCTVENGKRRMWNRNDISKEAFPLLYQKINKLGYSVGWYALPVTSSPPDSGINGFMVGADVGLNNKSYPEVNFHVNLEMYDSIFSHRAFSVEPDDWNERCERYLNDAIAFERANADTFIEAALKYDVDVGFVYFDKLDRLGHQCMDIIPIMNEMYMAYDENLGKLLDALSPERVIVISDHGMQIIPRKVVDINFPAQPDPNMNKTYISGDHRYPGIFGTSFEVRHNNYHMADVYGIILGVLA